MTQGTNHGERPEPLVTVCIPTIGRTRYLERTLDSLRAQTYRNIEVLVLDNASPPDSDEALTRFVRTIPGARRLRVDQRLPMFANFNRGLAEAKGAYVVFFHDDDIYAPEFLRRHVELLESAPGAVFAGGNYNLIDGTGARLRQRRLVRKTAVWSGRRFINDLLRRGRCALPTPGIVFRRSAFGPEGWDTTLPVNWGDFTILMRMAERGTVVVSAEIHYAWRVHGENGSNVPFHVAIPLRTEVCLAYVREFRARRPDDVAAADRWERLVRRSHTYGLVWGWWSARDDADAAACREIMRRTGLTRVLGLFLAGLERGGLSLSKRQNLLPVLRAVRRTLIS